ncbi:metal-dependent hydrolase family protein [Planctellipticum variicoloris]|uniref:metal-dependent hydrolase family protein n=1 Tax=Planctellipticum variicoloris TaxID=3064265 RepID=UPI0030137E4B|nr:amidohydrolase family protein [Planctomycetaceae bacterium SH412]
MPLQKGPVVVWNSSLLFALMISASSAEAATIIHAGRLIDGRSPEPRREVSITIEAGRITGVTAGYVEPGEGDRLIRLTEGTVLPGLMDMHTHLQAQHSKDSYTERFFMEQADYALRSTVYARTTLMAGFTTVRDLGDNGVNSIALRKAIERGWIPGPRIFTSGKSLATTGGHADPTNALRGDYRRDAGPLEGVINGPDDARKAVRQRYKDGADLIKLTATGGVLSLAASGQNPQFTEEELRAVVQTAKDYGMTVAVHAHGAEGIRRAILAGVDSIEHGTFMTDELIALMKEHGTYWVPTNMAGEWVAMKAEEPGYFPDLVRPKAAAIGPLMRDTFKRGQAAGVKIAFGTDSGVSPHGENAHEFELMVEGGMPPMQAIQSATLEAARLLKAEDRLGTIEPQKLADIIAVNGDPLAEIGTLRNVVFVMKEGVVYKQP